MQGFSTHTKMTSTGRFGAISSIQLEHWTKSFYFQDLWTNVSRFGKWLDTLLYPPAHATSVSEKTLALHAFWHRAANKEYTS
jgi:hypothetical protein